MYYFCYYNTIAKENYWLTSISKSKIKANRHMKNAFGKNWKKDWTFTKIISDNT